MSDGIFWVLLFISYVLIPLGVWAFGMWYVIHLYRTVGRSARTRFRQTDANTVPEALVQQAQALRDLGFHALATYVLDVPRALRDYPRYTFENEDTTIKAMLVKQGRHKGTVFSTLYPDGMLLATLHKMPSPPYLKDNPDEMYQFIEAKGSLQQAWDEHGAQAASLRPFHGAPIRTQSADEYRQLLNDHIVPRDVKLTAHAAYKKLRMIGIRTIIVFVVIAIPLAVMIRAIDTSLAFLIAPLGTFVFLSPIFITALVLAERIKRKYLQSPEVAQPPASEGTAT
jgi:hypothetical protein